jgi:hypothetical protein
MTISHRLLRALVAAGVCFALGASVSILFGNHLRVVPGILASTTVAVFVWRSTTKS